MSPNFCDPVVPAWRSYFWGFFCLMTMIFYFWAWFLVLKLQHICRNYVSLCFSTSGVIYHQESRNCELVIFCRDLKKVVNFFFWSWLVPIQNGGRYQHFLTYSGHNNAFRITYQRANLLWHSFMAKLPGNVLKTTGLYSGTAGWGWWKSL